MEDGLPRALAVVHDEPVVAQPFLLCSDTGDGEEVPDERLVRLFDSVGAGDRLAGDYEDMERRTWVDVAESDAPVVLVDDVGRQLLVGDLLEEGLFSHSGEERGEGGIGRVGRRLS